MNAWVYPDQTNETSTVRYMSVSHEYIKGMIINVFSSDGKHAATSVAISPWNSTL